MRVVERHKPVLLESKPSPRAQDSNGTDSESFTKPEERQRSATVATALLRDTSGRLIDRELQCVSPSDQRLTLSGQSLTLLPRRRFGALDLVEPVGQRRPPSFGVGPQGLGQRQQRRQFGAQVQLISTPKRRPSHMPVQSVELPTQLPVLDPSPSGIVIVGRRRMVVQRVVNRRGLATDRNSQPGELRDDVDLRADPQRRIVSPYRMHVKAGRAFQDAGLRSLALLRPAWADAF